MSRAPGPRRRADLAVLVAAIIASAGQVARESMVGKTVVLDRIVAERPDYCVHGETFCVACTHAVWLGPRTYDAVVAGARPLCLDCARLLLPTDTDRAHVDDRDHP